MTRQSASIVAPGAHLEAGRAPGPEENLLLASLPPSVREELLASADFVSLDKGQILHAAGDVVAHAYFPTGGLVSLQKLDVDGGSVELASIGRDGMVGLSLILRAPHAGDNARVQVAGRAVRVKARALDELLAEQPVARARLLTYAHDVIEDIGQGLLCHSLHAGLQRLCRWLLAAADRLGSDKVPLTHEALGYTLGVPRTGITRLVTELHDAGAISCRYGTITILNRRRLELSACECSRPPLAPACTREPSAN